MSTEQNEIRLPVPPRIYAKLKEIAGYRSVEAWAQDALARAAEEASPSLRSSGMWSMHASEWWSLVNRDDKGEDTPQREAECAYCTTHITLRNGEWMADDWTLACTDTSAPYVPHKPKTGD